MDDQRADDKVPRFHSKVIKGSMETRPSFLSTGGRTNGDVAYIVSAVPAIQNVLVRDGVHNCSDNDAEEYKGRKRLRADNEACNGELQRSQKISFQDSASNLLMVNICRVSPRPRKGTIIVAHRRLNDAKGPLQTKTSTGSHECMGETITPTRFAKRSHACLGQSWTSHKILIHS